VAGLAPDRSGWGAGGADVLPWCWPLAIGVSTSPDSRRCRPAALRRPYDGARRHNRQCRGGRDRSAPAQPAPSPGEGHPAAGARRPAGVPVRAPTS